MTKDELTTIIEAAAERHNVPADALLAIANLESSGNVNAQNPRSSASGLFQFVDSTAREYGLTGSKRNDPEAQAYAAAKMMATNSRALTRVLGREPDAGELYLAHQQGLGGATALLRAGDGLAVDALTGVYRSRAKAEAAIRLNGGSLDMSAADFAGKWVNKANQTAARIPAGSIPNTVASEIDVAPRRAVTLPTPVSQRPVQYEYTRAGRPIDPDNGFLMDKDDPRYREAAAGSPVESVRQSANTAQVPLPQPRPERTADVPLPRLDPRKPNRMDLAADVPTVERRLPPIFMPGGSYAGQERGPATAPREPEAMPTKAQVEAATGFRLPPTQVTPPGMPTPVSQRPASPLTEEVEVENPAYTALMKRVQQGEIELKGIAPSGMAMSRDARARYDQALADLEAKRQQLAGMSRTTTVTRQVAQQRAPVAVPAQSGGGNGGGGGVQTTTGTHTGRSYNVGQKYTMGGDTYTANANGGFTNDRTGRTQGKGSTYYDPDSNTFKVR